MKKYGFDLEMLNVLASTEECLAKICDAFKGNGLSYKDFIQERIRIMRILENEIKIEISDLELLESDLK